MTEQREVVATVSLDITSEDQVTVTIGPVSMDDFSVIADHAFTEDFNNTMLAQVNEEMARLRAEREAAGD